MPGKIPVRFREEFAAALDAAENPDLPDGAWMQVLVDAAARFIKKKKLIYVRDHDAVLQYLRNRAKKVSESGSNPSEQAGVVDTPPEGSNGNLRVD